MTIARLTELAQRAVGTDGDRGWLDTGGESGCVAHETPCESRTIVCCRHDLLRFAMLVAQEVETEKATAPG